MTDGINMTTTSATGTTVTDGTKTTELTAAGTTMTDGALTTTVEAGTIGVTDANGTTSISGNRVSVGGVNPIVINGDTGTIGGLTNLTWEPARFTSGQAAPADQLNEAST